MSRPRSETSDAYYRSSYDDVGLKDYVDARLEEKEKAGYVANEEREKSALALREALIRTIAEGDDRLREHVTSQIGQISAALLSAERLETERIRGLDEKLTAMINANRQQFTLIQEAAATAINKADAANNERLKSHNGLLEKMEQQQQHSDEAARLAAEKFAQKDLVDAVTKDRDRQIADNREAIVALREAVIAGSPEVKAILQDLQRQAIVAKDSIAELGKTIAVGSPDVKELLAGASETQGEKASNRNASRIQLALAAIFATVVIGVAGVLVALLSSHGATTLCQVGTKFVSC